MRLIDAQKIDRPFLTTSVFSKNRILAVHKRAIHSLETHDTSIKTHF